MTLPNLSSDRLEQMIHLAMSYKQEPRTVTLPWYQRVLNKLHDRSTRLVYGLSATAVSFSCVALIWFVPMMSPQNEMNAANPGDFSMSEYMMQDLLEDLNQSSAQT